MKKIQTSKSANKSNIMEIIIISFITSNSLNFRFHLSFRGRERKVYYYFLFLTYLQKATANNESVLIMKTNQSK